MTDLLPTPDNLDDPNLWLEEVEGDAALTWVREQNARSQPALEALPGFAAMRQRLLDTYQSQERTPYVAKHGEHFYNFWQDATHIRGLIRRTTLDQYRLAEPQWETVLDLDELARQEGEDWVYDSLTHLYPEGERCLLSLSRGGADASVVREFDLHTLRFVEGGFELEEAKSAVCWKDRDTLYVGTDFGPGSLTDSGYPRQVKLWQRDTPLAAAPLLFEGEMEDMMVAAGVAEGIGFRYDYLVRRADFYDEEVHLLRGDVWQVIDKPDDAEVDFWQQWLLLTLRSDWEVAGHRYLAGSLLVAPLEGYLRGERDFTVLFEPDERRSLGSIDFTQTTLLMGVLDNVADRLIEWRVGEDGRWSLRPVALPPHCSADVWSLDPDTSDDYFLTITDYLTPASLFLAQAGTDERKQLKQAPAFFDASPFEVRQQSARSADGTQIPYFVIARRDAPRDGSSPTLLYGYGGFEVSLTPGYDSTVGIAWLEQGGTYVVANIRGGGEFGPTWHQAALTEHRQRAYDDFASVAEDLIAQGITSPRHLGIAGGSNGGLLMGVMLTQRPELFRAVVCQVPLLDMRRYHLLLAGASWMAEYGDPEEPEDWAFLRRYSPYHQVKAGQPYPAVLFTTSTRDDRVHPGHARKMAAKMLAAGYAVSYYENIEGGHGGAADQLQSAYLDTLEYSFLMSRLR